MLIGTGAGALFRQQGQAAAAATHWQLLQITATSSPGVLKVTLCMCVVRAGIVLRNAAQLARRASLTRRDSAKSPYCKFRLVAVQCLYCHLGKKRYVTVSCCHGSGGSK